MSPLPKRLTYVFELEKLRSSLAIGFVKFQTFALTLYFSCAFQVLCAKFYELRSTHAFAAAGVSG